MKPGFFFDYNSFFQRRLIRHRKGCHLIGKDFGRVAAALVPQGDVSVIGAQKVAQKQNRTDAASLFHHNFLLWC